MSNNLIENLHTHRRCNKWHITFQFMNSFQWTFCYKAVLINKKHCTKCVKIFRSEYMRMYNMYTFLNHIFFKYLHITNSLKNNTNTSLINKIFSKKKKISHVYMYHYTHLKISLYAKKTNVVLRLFSKNFMWKDIPLVDDFIWNRYRWINKIRSGWKIQRSFQDMYY